MEHMKQQEVIYLNTEEYGDFAGYQKPRKRDLVL